MKKTRQTQKMTNPLVTTWLSRYPRPTDAQWSLNQALTRRDTLSRIGEWRRGKMPVPDAARRHMLAEILPDLIDRIRAARKRDLPEIEAEILAIISETLT